MTEFLKQCAEKDTLTAEDRKRLIEMAENVAEVVHAEWIQVSDTNCRCSNCEAIAFIAQYPLSADKNFCPNCGAKMDKESV